MQDFIHPYEAGLAMNQRRDIRLIDQGTTPIKLALHHPSNHPLNHVQLVPEQNSSDHLIVGKANNIGVFHLGMMVRLSILKIKEGYLFKCLLAPC